jgi:hypothetical protein
MSGDGDKKSEKLRVKEAKRLTEQHRADQMELAKVKTVFQEQISTLKLELESSREMQHTHQPRSAYRGGEESKSASGVTVGPSFEQQHIWAQEEALQAHRIAMAKGRREHEDVVHPHISPVLGFYALHGHFR